MHDRSLVGFFLMTCFVAFGVNASVTGGGGADGTTRDSLTGTSWNLVALTGEDIDPALAFRQEEERYALRTLDGALALTLVRDAAAASTSAATARSKIRFDIDRLDADGLQGPRDGLRALHYEYCIPDRPDAVREVTAIDPTLQIQRGSPGRVGCAAGELLCLGHTHQPGYRAVLQRLATLPFIAEIHEAFFE